MLTNSRPRNCPTEHALSPDDTQAFLLVERIAGEDGFQVDLPVGI